MYWRYILVMNKTRLFLIVLAITIFVLALSSCSDSQNLNESITGSETSGTENGGGDTADTDKEPQKKPIEGVVFDSLEVTFDGSEKCIVATSIPDGVTAVYESNAFTDAGVYNAKATLSGEGYETKVMLATLTIKKAEITGISLSDNESITADGIFHLPTVSGTIPNGVNSEWSFNGIRSDEGVKAIGTYEAVLILSGKNYNRLSLSTTFKIKPDLTDLASTVINSFKKTTPSVWSFLPESFTPENYLLEGNAPSYTDFVKVEDIPKKYMGKQLNVVIDALNKLETVLGYVDTVQGSLNAIEQVYTTFLNNSPDDYTSFSDDTGVFTYNITLTEDCYSLYAAIGDVNVKINSDLVTGEYEVRVRLTEESVLKYTVNEESFKIAVVILGSASTQIEFIRDSENTEILTGYIYEYLTIEGMEIKASSAYLYVGETYTTVVGTKGDFILTADARNCEVYNNESGCLVGTEVSEYVSLLKKSYDTLWYNIFDIAGISSIRKDDEKSGLFNPDTIYINGSTEKIHSMSVGLFDQSRRFDIEFKTVCAYTKNPETGTLEKLEFEVPMIFIQEDFTDSFSADYLSENDVNVSINRSDADKKAVNDGYYVLVEIYNLIKNSVTEADIKEYCEIIAE